MQRTRTWLYSHSLDLVIHKMELLLITGPRIPLYVDMSIINDVISTKSLVSYLGIRRFCINAFRIGSYNPCVSVGGRADGNF